MPIDFLTPAEPKRKSTVIVDIGTFSIRGSKLLVVQYLVGYYSRTATSAYDVTAWIQEKSNGEV